MGRQIALRRANADDQKPVTTLVAKAGGASRYRKQYGAFNSSLLDSSYLSIVAYDPLDQDGGLLGFICFSDGPRDNTPAETWLKESNDLFGQNWSTHSLLWVAFLVADPVPDIEQRTVEKMMRAAFATLPEINFAVSTLPFKEELPSEMKKHFRKLNQDKGVILPGGAVGGVKGGETVMLCERELLIPTLAVRKAVVEDNDDLLPIFKEHEKALKDSYGEFYVAELIKNQDLNNIALVAEHDSQAIGLVSISRHSGVFQLQEHFNLQHFGNLVKKKKQINQNQNKNQDVRNGTTQSQNNNENCPLFYSMIGNDEENMNRLCSEISQESSLIFIDPLTLLDENDEVQDDELMAKLMMKRMKSPDVMQNGAILLNYPKNTNQFQVLLKESNNMFIPNGFINSSTSSNDDLNDLYSYISSGGRVNNNTSSTTTKNEGKNNDEEKEEEGKKQESKEVDDDEAKQAENKSDKGDDDVDGVSMSNKSQFSFIPPIWTNISENENWLSLLIKQVENDINDKINNNNNNNSNSNSNVGNDEVEVVSNAFAITMFCLEGSFESRASDFLPHAFRAFPDLDYCILTIPSTVLSEPRIIRGFTPALPRPSTSYSQSLYVIHKDAILACTYLKVFRFYPSNLNNCQDSRKLFIEKQLQQQMKQRENNTAAVSSDVNWDAIEIQNKEMKEGYLLGKSLDKLLNQSLSMKKAKEVKLLLEQAGKDDDVPTKDNPPRAVFIASIGNTGAVGLIILDRSSLSADRINFLKTNFDLESYLVMDRFRTKAQAVVTTLIVDPIFHHQTRFILKESMRLFEKNLIYYQSDPSSDSDSWSYHPPRLVYQHFCPARPRRRPEPQPKNTNETGDSGSIVYERQDHALPPKGFSLQFLSRALLSEPRVSVQSRIVVIGATATTASFLEKFLLNSQLFYPNVTLISPTGFPCPKPSTSTSTLSPTNANHNSSHSNGSKGFTYQVINEDMPDEGGMNALTLESRCRLLKASVSSINRQEKTLTLSRTDNFTITNTSNNGNNNHYNYNDVLPYDYLIITDELVDMTKFDLQDRNGEMMNFKHVWNPHIDDENAIGMNNEIVSPVLSLTQPNIDKFIEDAIEKSQGGDIIVYGSSLQSVACLGGLLKKGISPKRLSFIRPGWLTSPSDNDTKDENRRNSDNRNSRTTGTSAAGSSNTGGGGTAAAGSSSPNLQRKLSKTESKNNDDDEGVGESKAQEKEEEWDEPLADWVRLQDMILGDNRSENILTDKLKALGIYDRNDIELLGVTGDKSTAISMKKYLNDMNSNNGLSSNVRLTNDESKNSKISNSDVRDTNDLTNDENMSLSINNDNEEEEEEDERSGDDEDDDNDEDDDDEEEVKEDEEDDGIMKTCLNMALFQKIGTTETLNLQCSVLLTCHNVNIRPSLFQAINSSGLAYNGKLVVNPSSMQTTDDYIFAAGDLTKFSKKYQIQCHDHCFYSNLELGEYLADSFSAFVDPSVMNPTSTSNNISLNEKNSSSEYSLANQSQASDDVSQSGYNNNIRKYDNNSMLVPMRNSVWNAFGRSTIPIFKKPRTLKCLIPGGYHIRSTLASAIDPKLVVKQTHDGMLIEEASGNAAWYSLSTPPTIQRNGNKSCVLRLDANNRLVDFAYVGPSPVEARNLGCLIGLHASYVKSCGNLHQRGNIEDWISFFRSEWAQPLYHDRFPQLINLLRNRLRTDDAAKDVLELMKRALEDGKDDQAVSKILTNAIGSEGERVTPGTAKRVEQVGFEWLSTNKSSFPAMKLPDRSNK